MYTIILLDGEASCEWVVQHNNGSANGGKYDLSK